MQVMDPIVGLILTGVLDRHPGLRIVMAEAGLAWVPHMIQKLDNQYTKLKEHRLDLGGQTGSRLLPSEYFRR
jgi:predicted TIM-barrel fold metal-dependent hydrolase